MSPQAVPPAQRVLIFAPRGRDAVVAKALLREAHIHSEICVDLDELVQEIKRGAELAVITEESVRGVDTRELANWIASQPPWSDFPFVVLTEHGGGLERNPTAAQLTNTLGNVSFLERPFHPTTLVSIVETNLRGRMRQYECRRLNEELEFRVQERTAELAAANRQLLAQIEERERVEMTLRQMQRLEAVGQLTSGVAHDFNNLLTVVLGNIGFLEKGLQAAGVDGKLAQRLSYMRTAAERGAKLTDQLLSFSRRQRLEPKALDLNLSIAGMRDLLQTTLGGSIRLETRLSHGLWSALVDPTQLELAVLNLAINARDAMPGGGILSLSTANVTLGAPLYPEEPPAGDYVEVVVADSGEGMSEDVLARAFEPFFTTKDIGKGSGLGLSQVLGFVKQSNGGVRIASKVGEGTSVHIYLPRAASRAQTHEHTTRLEQRQAFSARILLVDDDNAVREITAATLTELGHHVLEVGSGGAALDLIEREPQIDLAIVDFAMPGMNGAELARRLQSRKPMLPILFVTGFADRAALAGVSEAHIIGKPFLDGELADKIGAALRQGAGANVVPLRR